MGIMANDTNASSEFPQPKPMTSYMDKPARGRRPPRIDLSTVFAATADAAYFVYASMRYC